VNPLWVWILGLVPPTDIEHRVRKLQRAVFERLGLSAGLALPVLIPLHARTGPPGGEPPFRLPPGRLEAGRLVASGPAVRDPWLLWAVQGEIGAGNWPTLLAGTRAGELPEGQRGGLLFPRDPGFPLAFSVSPETLRSAGTVSDTGPARAFQPLRIGVYRVRSLRTGAGHALGGGADAEARPPEEETHGEDTAAAAAAMWEHLFRFGLIWEEMETKPLRRQAL
jgi:hypothetical protein